MPDSVNTTGTDNLPRGGQGFPTENPDGSPALIGPDEYTKAIQRERLERGNTTVVGGNYADLQRMGEKVAGGPGTSDPIAAPPGLDVKADNVVTAPQAAAARGEYDRETIRTGLLDAPPAPEPAENREANSVDPTSVSPRAEGGSGTSTSTPTPTKKA